MKSDEPRPGESAAHSKARGSLAFWLAVRLWLLVAGASILSLYAPGGSFVWPVALAACAAVLAPLGVQDELRAWGFGPPLWRLLRQGGPKVSLTNVDILSTKMAASAAQWPGLLFVALCALALPVAPFQHGMLIVVALGASILVWPAAATIAAQIGSALGRARWSVERWRQVCGAVVAACALLLAFALVQCVRRPSPDRYWNSLASIFVSKPLEEYEMQYGALRVKSRPRDQAKSCRGGGSVCCDALDDATCFCFGTSTVGGGLANIGTVGNGGGFFIGCPFIEVRREAKGGRKVISRKEKEDSLLFGQSSAHVYDPTFRTSWNGSNEGALLSTLAVGDAVGVPLPWIVLAGAGLGFVGWIFWRERFQSRAEARGWVRADLPDGANVSDPADRAQEQALVRQYTVLVLAVSSAPMILAVALGVGR